MGRFIRANDDFFNQLEQRIIRDKKSKEEVAKRTGKKYFCSFEEATGFLAKNMEDFFR